VRRAHNLCRVPDRTTRQARGKGKEGNGSVYAPHPATPARRRPVQHEPGRATLQVRPGARNQVCRRNVARRETRRAQPGGDVLISAASGAKFARKRLNRASAHRKSQNSPQVRSHATSRSWPSAMEAIAGEPQGFVPRCNASAKWAGRPRQAAATLHAARCTRGCYPYRGGVARVCGAPPHCQIDRRMGGGAPAVPRRRTVCRVCDATRPAR